MSNKKEYNQQKNIKVQANAVLIDIVSYIRKKKIYKINCGQATAIGFFL